MEEVKTYLEEWIERIKELNKIKHRDLPSLEERNKQVNDMIEEYMQVQGDLPPSYWLSRLGTYILAEDLKNNDRDKVANTEYPILSYRQKRRRSRKQIAVLSEHLDFLHSKYVARMDSLAKTTITDDIEE